MLVDELVTFSQGWSVGRLRRRTWLGRGMASVPGRRQLWSGDGADRGRVEPGDTLPGTRFELVVDYRGRESRALSRTWQGRLRAVTPPALEGTVAVGSRVRVRPARWRGGWRERNASRELRIEACRAPELVECEVLAAPEQIAETDASVVISRYYSGCMSRRSTRTTQRTAFSRAPGIRMCRVCRRWRAPALSRRQRPCACPVDASKSCGSSCATGSASRTGVPWSARCAARAAKSSSSPPRRSGRRGGSSAYAVSRRCSLSAAAAAAPK
jgi:hypothetical protein